MCIRDRAVDAIVVDIGVADYQLESRTGFAMLDDKIRTEPVSYTHLKRITALVLSAGLTLSMLPMTSMPVHAATTKVCNTVEELQAAVKRCV